MNPAPAPSSRCGLDTVEIVRIEKLLRDTPAAELRRFFSPQELSDAGDGPGRAASLAARFAAKEACCKLFPRETSLGVIEPVDFSVQRDGYGAPGIEPSPNARAVMDRHRVSALRVSLTHTDISASAIAWPEPAHVEVPWFGKLMYYLLPVRRRVVLENLRRVFGDVVSREEIRRLAQAYYAHFIRFVIELVRLPLMSEKQKENYVRVENKESPLRAHDQGRGVLILTGHFGSWEVSTVAGLAKFPQYRGLFYIVRRPFKPRWLNRLITARTIRGGLGSLNKQGSLDQMLDLLARGNIVIYVFDQHAAKRDGVLVDFLGHPAGTHKSLAVLAMSTGAEVVPASSWREPDGTHVLRFEEPLPLIECENTSEAIRRNTQSYNDILGRMLLRHPEQWIWMHKRWKADPKAKPAPASPAAS